jgi:uncharacterized protein YjiS (DUF1127 family)
MILVMLSQTAAETGRFLAMAATSIGGAIARVLKEWRYRSDIHKLQSLSDRQLSDIGLTRGRIEDAVRGGVASQKFARNSSLRSQFLP